MNAKPLSNPLGNRPERPARTTEIYHRLSPEAMKGLEEKFPMDARAGQDQLLLQLGQQMVLKAIRNGFAVSN